MNDIDIKILEAVNTLSTMSFVSPIKVNEILKLDAGELGNRLADLKKSGHVEVLTCDYASSNTLPNFISKVRITELGLQCLEK
jgi:RIO-like serine/threonine protein kinase